MTGPGGGGTWFEGSTLEVNSPQTLPRRIALGRWGNIRRFIAWDEGYGMYG